MFDLNVRRRVASLLAAAMLLTPPMSAVADETPAAEPAIEDTLQQEAPQAAAEAEDNTDTSAATDAEEAPEAEETDESETVEAIEEIEVIEQSAFTLIKYGNTGSTVTEIQERLAELGYFNTKPTGNFGSVTREAVKAFQMKCGLTADGVIGQKTYDRLFAEDAPRADGAQPTQAPVTEAPATDVPAPTDYYIPIETEIPTEAPVIATEAPVQPTTAPTEFVPTGAIPVFERDLSVGSVGSLVKEAQRRLNTLGYDCGTADGAFGNKTAAAVRAFQLKCGIAVTGEINYETHLHLYSDNAPYSTWEEPAATLPAAATAQPVFTVTEAPTVTASPIILMQNGSRGGDVKELQRKLTELGYFSSAVDGAYGKRTVAAVILYQIDNGLPQTGAVDQVTYDKIFEIVPTPIPTQEPTMAPTAVPTAQSSALRMGSSGDEVKKLQLRLKELGFYNGSTQGAFGELTAAALKTFQKAVGLAQTGELDEATSRYLYSVDAPVDMTEYGDYTELTAGDSGEDVRELQQRLSDLGFLTGSGVDGYFGSGTQAAVKAFQIAHGLAVSGVADITTQQALFADGATVATTTASPTPIPTPAIAVGDYQVLVSGAYGSDVRALQQRLSDLGYLSDRVDGAFGAKTAAALMAFQSKVALTATGVADSYTQSVLFSEYAPAAADPAWTTQTVLPTAEPTAPASGYITLRQGYQGEEVSALQARLKELEYYTGEINSIYDDVTISAVKTFQKANSLSVDGVAGEKTQTRLYSADAIKRSEMPEEKDDGSETNIPKPVSGTPKKPVITNIIEMNWFENTSGFFNRESGTFSIGTTAIVTDVKTGICYTVRRMGGTNHADVEPLTKFDAWQMYRIYGQNWSWTRRAVVVTVGGRNIAASINGMPHGGQTITNNDFIGHSCIHFTNSRTHGTNRVDPDHQNAVKTALNTSVSALNAKIQAQ